MASSTLYSGYGEAPWSEGSFGTELLLVNVDGVTATASVGDEAVVAKATVTVSGLAGTTGLGEESLVTDFLTPEQLWNKT